MNNVLISHSTNDSELSRHISNLIERSSLRQIVPWFSSDKKASGGFAPGDRWFDTLRTQLLDSKAVIVLITPNSLKSSWVMFESGFDAAQSKLEIMPLLCGIKSIDQIPDPLSHWQSYQIDDKEQCIQFIEKLFQKAEVHFDKEFCIQNTNIFSKELVDFDRNNSSIKDDVPASKEDIDNLKNLIERKMFNVSRKIESGDFVNFDGYYIYKKFNFRKRYISIHTI